MGQTSKRKLLAEVRPRYTLGNRTAKRRILDELVVVTGYHRFVSPRMAAATPHHPRTA